MDLNQETLQKLELAFEDEAKRVFVEPHSEAVEEFRVQWLGRKSELQRLTEALREVAKENLDNQMTRA